MLFRIMMEFVAEALMLRLWCLLHWGRRGEGCRVELALDAEVSIYHGIQKLEALVVILHHYS